MLYLVSYDIANHKRLHKFALYCEKFGIRLQKSIFQIDCGKDTIDAFVCGIPQIISRRADSVIIYPICADCMRQAKAIGNENLIEPDKVVIL